MFLVYSSTKQSLESGRVDIGISRANETDSVTLEVVVETNDALLQAKASRTIATWHKTRMKLGSYRRRFRSIAMQGCCKIKLHNL